VKPADSARCALWMQPACPVCGAAPGQRCRVAPGAFQSIFHRERALKKPPASESAPRMNRRVA
jgi:hypothetical protein